MGVVIGMARRVQHQSLGKPVRRVPALRHADRGGLAVRRCGPAQAIVLDIIRQQDLAAGVQAKPGPDQKAGQAGNQRGKDQRRHAAADVKDIGVRALAAGPAQGVFRAKALGKAAGPGAAQEGVKAFPRGRRVGVIRRSHKAVMHQAMRRGVVAEQQGGIHGQSEPE